MGGAGDDEEFLVCRAAWHSAALSLITGIEGYGDKSCFGKLLGIEACYLVLAAPVGMSYNHGRMLLSRIVTRWRKYIRHPMETQ